MKATLRFLAVEDSEADAEIIARHLAKAGLDCVIDRVQTEPDFSLALEALKPDLIISDFSLPQFDGLKALEIAAARAPETPFIFISGTIGEERAVEALRRGATDYVLKSNLSRLSSAVERALREAKLKTAQRQSEQQRREEEARLGRLARRLTLDVAALEETVRLRTTSLEQANVQLHEQIQLRQAIEADLDRAQKLEAVGRLAAGIAHEITTPIQYIGDSMHFLKSAFEEMLTVAAAAGRPQDGNPTVDLPFLHEEVPRAIDRIMEGVQRVATIVGAMKEFAHPDAAEKTPADLNRALETTLLIARSEYKYVATPQLYLGEIPKITCNVGELSQVFLNLIVNSAHGLADAGRDSETGTIIIRSALVEGCVELQFEDNGCGIPPEIVDRIYDPFFTTKEIGRGTGQGLAIARTIIVDRHSGSINVASTPGVGTCFTLRLPVDTAAGDES